MAVYQAKAGGCIKKRFKAHDDNYDAQNIITEPIRSSGAYRALNKLNNT